MGKSEENLAKRNKPVTKSPISPIWLGMFLILFLFSLKQDNTCALYESMFLSLTFVAAVILAFVVFGGLIFEVLSRIFGR